MKRGCFSFVILIFVCIVSFSDSRSQPMDVFLVIDQSVSMKDDIREVGAYIDSSLIDSVLIPGDSLTVIGFFGSASVLLEKGMGTTADIESASGFLSRLVADGQYTDIGNALNELDKALARHPSADRKKLVRLYTDLEQEAPPLSSYPSLASVSRHPDMASVKTVSHGRWKEITIGIGVDALAEIDAAKVFGSISRTASGTGRGQSATGSVSGNAGEAETGITTDAARVAGPGASGTKEGALPPAWMIAAAGILILSAIIVFVVRKRKKS
jgi:hypothetical protein